MLGREGQSFCLIESSTRSGSRCGGVAEGQTPIIQVLLGENYSLKCPDAGAEALTSCARQKSGCR